MRHRRHGSSPAAAGHAPRAAATLAALLLAACSGGGGTFDASQGAASITAPNAPGMSASPSATGSPGATVSPSATPASGASAAPAPISAPSATPGTPADAAGPVLPAGFSAAVIAKVNGARELAALPNGDLLVGTSGSSIVRVPHADAALGTGSPAVYARLPDDDAAGIALGSDGTLYAGTEHAIWRISGVSGASTAATIARIASVRTGPIAPNSDGDVHHTTSVAVSGSTLFAGVGSSCNACTEADPTRASVQQLALAGGALSTKATKLRNPIAMTVDPANGSVWAGGAGQDTLPFGHPYETLDALTAHAGVVDYGWPNCYDDRIPVSGSAAACASMTVPALVFPAYSTLIGAAFYPAGANGPYAFPAAYRGGLFVTMHGSWHTAAGGRSAAQPLVAFVPFASGSPSRAVNWSDPTAQWQPFFNNFGTTADSRIGRPTGVAVGARGSLFVADDLTGSIYRIRPASAVPAAVRARR